MKRWCAPIVGFVMISLSLMTSAGAVAGDKVITDSGSASFDPIINLLKEKKIISGDEAASLLRKNDNNSEQGENVKKLINLLREKGLISDSEAGALNQKTSNTTGTVNESADSLQTPASGAVQPSENVPAVTKIFFPSDDKGFIAGLKRLWVKNGKPSSGFDDAFATTSDIEEIIRRMQAMGTLSPAEADDLMKQYRETYLTGAVSTILENRKKDYLEQIKQNSAWEIDNKIHNMIDSEWFKRIRLSGNFRLRYEGDFYDPNNATLLNPSNPTQIMDTTVDKERFRIKAQLRADVKVAEGLEAEIGLSTGTTNNESSPNVTIGDSFNNQTVVFDRIFLKWNPIQSLTFLGGRFANPFFFTDLVWYPEINFDGAAIQYRPQLTDAWSLFSTIGGFPIFEDSLPTSQNKWLFAGQLGVQYKHGKDLTIKGAVAYYDFVNTVGVENNPANPGLTNWTAPQFQQKGNTLMDIDPSSAILTAYASAFRELDFTGAIDLGYWDPIHVIFIGDYVNNLGFNQQDVNARTGGNVQKETEGYQFGVTIGYPTVQDYLEWKGLLYYKHLESDAVMDAFADQDFHLGGTNCKGWIIGADLGLSKNVWLSTRWFSANEISGPPLGIDVFQFDINTKF